MLGLPVYYHTNVLVASVDRKCRIYLERQSFKDNRLARTDPWGTPKAECNRLKDWAPSVFCLKDVGLEPSECCARTDICLKFIKKDGVVNTWYQMLLTDPEWLGLIHHAWQNITCNFEQSSLDTVIWAIKLIALGWEDWYAKICYNTTFSIIFERKDEFAKNCF